ncbi:hypothetical protein OXH62_10835 [Pseudomonas chlororaphis]|uniref:hypothetical protein n=1 Tax=Pseudomonas chlororaphis TaxID=587753 RepID=UPI0035D3F905
MATEIEEAGSAVITFPVNGASVRNSSIPVSGTVPVTTLPLVLRMYQVSNPTPVAQENVPLPSTHWSTQLHGVFAPGSYYIVATQTGDTAVNVTLRVPPVIISSPTSGAQLPDKQFPVTGTGGEYNIGTVVLYNASNNNRLGEAVIEPTGTWTATLMMAGNSLGFYARQTIGAFSSANSATVNVTYKVAPVVITSPVNNDVVTTPRPTVSGDGETNASITVHLAGNPADVYGSGTVVGGKWKIPLSKSLPLGSITLQATQDYNGDKASSNQVRITVEVETQKPVITCPDALSRQKTTFRVGGTGGVDGALMEIVRDLDHSKKVGEATVTDDFWSVEVTDEPGRIGLVARQTVPSRPPVYSLLARAFDIIPPAITGVVVTNPSVGIVQFSGHGLDGATVFFKKISGPDGDAPNEAVVSNGTWQTAVTGWVYGQHELEVIQTISNNAGGRIESEPFPLKVTYSFPPPSNVKSDAQYQPTISGDGLIGAKVSVLDSDQLTKIAPDAAVGNDNRWLTTAYVSWGATWDRSIYAHQYLGSEKSASVEHKVRIPPIMPGIDSVSPDGLSPTFTGTCELNARVNLVFSGSDTSFPALVSDRKWSFQRTQPFTPDTEHTITAIQIAAQQLSPAAVRSFQLNRPMEPVVITDPAQNSEIGHGEVTFKGTGGMKGATVSVWDYVNGGTLGSVTLEADGWWEIVVQMTFGRWVVRAKQVIDGRDSPHSDSCVFDVVLLQPEIGIPKEADTRTRTSMIEGRGEPRGYVDVFLEDSKEPFLEKVSIGSNGEWRAEAIMPVGYKTIKARQYFQNQISKDTKLRTYVVVPHSGVMETPAAYDHVGKKATASGFGVPGDRVKVKLGPGTGPALGEALVGEDRTWSVQVEIPHAGPDVSLAVTSSEGAFESAASAPRPVLAGIFEPSIEIPAEGRPVSNPVHFAGTGQDGEAQICSWFNPDVIQASGLPVTTAAGWRGAASIALSPDGNWSVIQQTLTADQDGATVSDKVTSHRFEVGPVPSERKSSDIPDKRSP